MTSSSRPASAGSPEQSAALAHAQLMDRMYALQRYVYDLTRKYYLFGRDRLIAQMPVSPGDRVAEIGCGTGRNLVLLAQKHPESQLYGIDAASVMIDSAEKKAARADLAGHIHLRQGMAEALDVRAWFDVERFDRIFFSYSLSMIPSWRASLEAALSNLAPGGELWVVDFWDQAGYPGMFRWTLKRWLAMFHVQHRPELLEYLLKLQTDARGSITIEPVGRRYAYLARFVKNG